MEEFGEKRGGGGRKKSVSTYRASSSSLLRPPTDSSGILSPGSRRAAFRPVGGDAGIPKPPRKKRKHTPNEAISRETLRGPFRVVGNPVAGR